MTISNKTRRLSTLTSMVLITTLLFSCSDDAPKRKHARGQLVEVTTVNLSPMVSKHALSGTLEAKHTVEIYNQEEGIIVSLFTHEGDVVEKDQLLAKLDARLISAELNKAKITHRQAALDYKRLKRLRKKRLTTDDALAQAKTTLELTQAEESVLQTRYQFTQVKAPFAGVITQRLKDVGDVVPKYSHILTLSDLSQLKAKVSVSEWLLPEIQQGQKVELRIDALGTKIYPAILTRVFPTIDKATRQGMIEITLDSPPQKAIPGQLIQVILENKMTARLHIPLIAVKHNHDGSYVYKIESNKARQIKITTGIQLGENIEVLTGLRENDKVVTQGFLGLSNNKSVNVSTRKKK